MLHVILLETEPPLTPLSLLLRNLSRVLASLQPPVGTAPVAKVTGNRGVKVVEISVAAVRFIIEGRSRHKPNRRW